MPRRANVLLVQKGLILDCLKRVGPEENRYRLSLPNHDYMPPPPLRGRIQPDQLTADDLRLILAQAKKSVQTRRILTGRILGMSPLLAKEIVFAAAGDPEAKVSDTDSAALFAAFQAITAPLLRRQWQPGIGLQKSHRRRICRLPPVLYRMAGRPLDKPGNHRLLRLCHRRRPPMMKPKNPCRPPSKKPKSNSHSKRRSLQQGLKDKAELETLKQSGELILAYQYSIQDGQEELKAQYDIAEPERLIRPQPQANSPSKTPQDYFRQYEKAKAARRAVPQLIKKTQLEWDFVAQLENDLITAASWPEIDDVIQALQARGYWQGKKLKRLGGGGRQGPLKIVTSDGYVIWIGRSSRQNEKITFATANGSGYLASCAAGPRCSCDYPQ